MQSLPLGILVIHLLALYSTLLNNLALIHWDIKWYPLVPEVVVSRIVSVFPWLVE